MLTNSLLYAKSVIGSNRTNYLQHGCSYTHNRLPAHRVGKGERKRGFPRGQHRVWGFTWAASTQRGRLSSAVRMGESKMKTWICPSHQKNRCGEGRCEASWPGSSLHICSRSSSQVFWICKQWTQQRFPTSQSSATPRGRWEQQRGCGTASLPDTGVHRHESLMDGTHNPTVTSMCMSVLISWNIFIDNGLIFHCSLKRNHDALELEPFL